MQDRFHPGEFLKASPNRAAHIGLVVQEGIGTIHAISAEFGHQSLERALNQPWIGLDDQVNRRPARLARGYKRSPVERVQTVQRKLGNRFDENKMTWRDRCQKFLDMFAKPDPDHDQQSSLSGGGNRQKRLSGLPGQVLTYGPRCLVLQCPGFGAVDHHPVRARPPGRHLFLRKFSGWAVVEPPGTQIDIDCQTILVQHGRGEGVGRLACQGRERRQRCLEENKILLVKGHTAHERLSDPQHTRAGMWLMKGRH